MEKNKLVKLIEQLSSKSMKGELDWEQTDKEGIFQLTLAKYTIRISVMPASENPDALDIFLAIYNEEGSLIERAVDYDMKNEFVNSYKIFKEIYDNARRKAMGVDKALDDILASLDPDVDSPF